MKSKKGMQQQIQESPQILQELLSHIKEETDRGAILSAAAALDDVLVSLLSGFLSDNKSSTKLLTGYDAPLGTFSSRIAMANALGLLSEEEHADLEILRQIRNWVAHRWSGVSFENEDLRKLSQQLRMVSVGIQESGNEPRECFNCAFTLLMLGFITRVAAVKHLDIHSLVGSG